MAKSKKVSYNEDDLIELFKLTRIGDSQTPEMQHWLGVQPPTLSIGEQETFDRVLPWAARDIAGWGEEELKMNFISQILPLGHIQSNGRYKTFYEKTVTAIVAGIELSPKTDFMIATSAFSKPKVPYFHFQEYKSSRPTGDSMAQLLEAMLVAQEKNKNEKPVYGCEIVGKEWSFVILKDKTYCVSEAFNSIKKAELLSIIAILRHFKHILETELLDAE